MLESSQQKLCSRYDIGKEILITTKCRFDKIKQDLLHDYEYSPKHNLGS